MSTKAYTLNRGDKSLTEAKSIGPSNGHALAVTSRRWEKSPSPLSKPNPTVLVARGRSQDDFYNPGIKGTGPEAIPPQAKPIFLSALLRRLPHRRHGLPGSPGVSRSWGSGLPESFLFPLDTSWPRTKPCTQNSF